MPHHHVVPSTAPASARWRRFAHAVAAALLLPACIASATPAQLQADMAQLLAAQGLQGAVWSTLESDGTVATGAAGIKDARSGASMTAQDRVHVGSVTKTVLAVGVLRLVSQGRLTLDTPIAQLLPNLKFNNPWASSDPIRVRHLLDHTAGLDDARFSQIFSLAATPGTPLAQAVRLGGDVIAVRSRPGSHCSYSNLGYTLLGMVIEALVVQPYETYLDTHLLQPLGMRDSTFAYTTQDGAGADPRLAMGHFEAGAYHAAVPIFMRPAGQYTTTAADMALLARFLMSDGRLDGAPFIDASLLRAMGQPGGTVAARAGLPVGYGLGLARYDRHGATGLCHAGSGLGYHAMFCLFPAEQRAFFLSINADSETADYGRFDARLIAALQLQPPPLAPRTTAATDRAITAGDAWEGYYIPAPNRFASLAWLDTVFGFIHLSRQGNGLRLTPFQGPTLMLAPAGGALFRAPGRVLPSHALSVETPAPGAQGTPQWRLSRGTQSYAQVSPLYLLGLWISLAAGVLGLLYIAAWGVVRPATWRRHRTAPRLHPLLLPCAGIAALLLPLPLFFAQSFLRLGELTLASATLAFVTAALPVCLLAGLALSWRNWKYASSLGRAAAIAALVCVLQLTLVLATQGLLPLRLWA